MLSVKEYIRHILDEAVYLNEQVQKISRHEFLLNETLKRAFVRSIEIIGEAAKNVPDEIRKKYPDIEWRAMAGMRDRLVHGYFGVDYDIVWNVVTHNIPVLRDKIEVMLKDESF